MVELNGGVQHAKRDGVVPSGGIADLDVVMIVLTVNMRLAQENPVGGMRCGSKAQQTQ